MPSDYEPMSFTPDVMTNEERVRDAVSKYESALSAAEQLRVERDAAIYAAIESGRSEYRVAQWAGLSHSAVSRIRRRFEPRAAIAKSEDAARELGFKPKVSARLGDGRVVMGESDVDLLALAAKLAGRELGTISLPQGTRRVGALREMLALFLGLPAGEVKVEYLA